MSKIALSKKTVSAKLVSYVVKAFQELSGSKPSAKGLKSIIKSSRKLVKTIYFHLKKADKKKIKAAKAVASKKTKVIRKPLVRKQKSSSKSASKKVK